MKDEITKNDEINCEMKHLIAKISNCVFVSLDSINLSRRWIDDIVNVSREASDIATDEVLRRLEFWTQLRLGEVSLQLNAVINKHLCRL